MVARVTLSDRFGGRVTWKDFPTLESIYEEMAFGGGSHCQERYYGAVVAACESEGASALAIELSVVDRQSSVSDAVAFYTSFYRIRWAPIELVLSKQGEGPDGDYSPYEAAMAAMTDGATVGRGEPIVLHPGLRDAELLYLVSPPLGEPYPLVTISQYKMESPRRWEGALLRSAITEVEDQVQRFRGHLQREISDLSDRFVASSGENVARRLFDAATLVVVPFLRDPWADSAEETVGGFGDFTTQAGGATGLVVFVWLNGPDGVTAEELGDRVGNRILELHRVLTMKDSLAKSNLLVRKNHFLQTAAHDIKSQINALQLDRLKNLFFPYERREHLIPELCKIVTEPDVWNPGDDNLEILVDFAKAISDTQAFVIGMLQGVELGTGPRKIRVKFQARKAYTADELLDHALSAANRWLERANRSIRLEIRRFPNEPECSPDMATILFPTGYYSRDVVSAQIMELLINAGKHGRVDGSVVVVEVTLSEKIVANTARLTIKLANWNERRLKSVANKTSALNYAEGIDVKSRLIDHDQGQRYSVKLAFGPAPRELKPDGPLEIVAPKKIQQGGIGRGEQAKNIMD